MTKTIAGLSILIAIGGFVGILLASEIEQTTLYEEAIGVFLFSIALSLSVIAYDKGS